ncbi:hypothetical protein LOK49_LG06G02243 [Camellia lanceoleosa]|uniref:Uncharacterized protein n=1 Tax=Camellia lanceoleosa TaxID=1840588 RepID=A0ACC0HB51_9ERIC|nr:hypothetical protein LOK49_LG06G02243 [Camellia lanceoleosa]
MYVAPQHSPLFLESASQPVPLFSASILQLTPLFSASVPHLPPSFSTSVPQVNASSSQFMYPIYDPSNMPFPMPSMYSVHESYQALLNNTSGYDSQASYSPACSQVFENEKNSIVKFVLVWNQIISSFREEDVISNRIFSLNDGLEQDPKLLATLVESRKRQAPYVGAFLLKDEPGTDPNMASGSDTTKNRYVLKGKELFNCLNEVGTLAQDKPYNKDDDVIKATSFEVISTMRDVLKTSSLWRDHVQTYTQ